MPEIVTTGILPAKKQPPPHSLPLNVRLVSVSQLIFTALPL